MSRPRIFRRLLPALKSQEAKSKLVELEKSLARQRAQESGGFLTGMAKASLPEKAREAVEATAEKAYRGARAADVAVAHQAAKIPGLGRLFQTTEKAPIRTIAKTPQGEIREIVEAPSVSLTAPIQKSQRIAAPILAFIGLEHLMGEGKTNKSQASQADRRAVMESKYAEVLKLAANALREREDLTQQQKRAMEILAEKTAEAELYKEAAEFTHELLQAGVIEADEIGTKIAELVRAGAREIEVQRAAMQFMSKKASFGEPAEKDGSSSEGEKWDSYNNPINDLLADFAFSTGIGE